MNEQLLRQRVTQLKAMPRKRTSHRKTYLNKADREEVMFLAALAGKMDELLAGWEERGRPGVLIRAAKLAKYWAYQAYDLILADVDDQRSIDQLMVELGRAEIIVKEA